MVADAKAFAIHSFSVTPARVQRDAGVRSGFAAPCPMDRMPAQGGHDTERHDMNLRA